ncbi:MAG: hypothetical protein ABIG42_02880 [bacterium]
MRKLIICVIGLSLLITLVAGCGKNSEKMRPAKKKNPQGLAMQTPQVKEGEHGKSVMEITEDLKYPGMESYESSKYSFTTKDPPQTVSDWFESNLSGSNVIKKTGKHDGASKWTVTWKKYIIDIVSYDSGALIMYKLDMD